MTFHLGNLRLYKPGIIKSFLSRTVESQQLCLLACTVAMAPIAQSCYGVCGRVRESTWTKVSHAVWKTLACTQAASMVKGGARVTSPLWDGSDRTARTAYITSFSLPRASSFISADADVWTHMLELHVDSNITVDKTFAAARPAFGSPGPEGKAWGWQNNNSHNWLFIQGSKT